MRGSKPAHGAEDERRSNETVTAHSGILSCFFQGFSSFLLRSMLSARDIRLRVECGMITSSMKPRSAATNGLAKRFSYSLTRASILLGSPNSDLYTISAAPLGPMTAISAVGQA